MVLGIETMAEVMTLVVRSVGDAADGRQMVADLGIQAQAVALDMAAVRPATVEMALSVLPMSTMNAHPIGTGMIDQVLAVPRRLVQQLDALWDRLWTSLASVLNDQTVITLLNATAHRFETIKTQIRSSVSHLVAHAQKAASDCRAQFDAEVTTLLDGKLTVFGSQVFGSMHHCARTATTSLELALGTKLL